MQGYVVVCYGPQRYVAVCHRRDRGVDDGSFVEGPRSCQRGALALDRLFDPRGVRCRRDGDGARCRSRRSTCRRRHRDSDAQSDADPCGDVANARDASPTKLWSSLVHTLDATSVESVGNPRTSAVLTSAGPAASAFAAASASEAAPTNERRVKGESCFMVRWVLRARPARRRDRDNGRRRFLWNRGQLCGEASRLRRRSRLSTGEGRRR